MDRTTRKRRYFVENPDAGETAKREKSEKLHSTNSPLPDVMVAKFNREKEYEVIELAGERRNTNLNNLKEQQVVGIEQHKRDVKEKNSERRKLCPKERPLCKYEFSSEDEEPYQNSGVECIPSPPSQSESEVDESLKIQKKKLLSEVLNTINKNLLAEKSPYISTARPLRSLSPLGPPTTSSASTNVEKEKLKNSQLANLSRWRVTLAKLDWTEKYETELVVERTNISKQNLKEEQVISLPQHNEYELSSEDEEPYQDSEDDYMPSPASQSESEIDELSTIQQKKSFSENFNPKRKSLCMEKSPSTSTAVPGTSGALSSSEPAATSSFSAKHGESSNDDGSMETEAILRLLNGEVTLQITKTLHVGHYSCKMVSFEKEFLAIIQTSQTKKHTCVYGQDECLYVRNKESFGVELSTKTCCPMGRLKGTEHAIGNQFVAALHYPDKTPLTSGIKKHCCVFCQTMVKHMTDHLKTVHPNESEVKRALSFGSNTKERVDIFRMLRNKGDRSYNENVLPEKRIPRRQPTKTHISEFLNCEKCDSLIAPGNFAKHNRKCTNRPANYTQVTREARKKASYNETEFQDTLVTKLLTPLQNDEYSHLIRSDTALQAFTRQYSVSANKYENKGKNIRMQLRLLARLLVTVQTLDESILEYKDVLCAGKYDILIRGTMILSKVAKSSTCLLLKSCIKNLAESLKLRYTQHPDKEKHSRDINILKEFIALHDAKYNEHVDKIANESRATNMRVSKNVKLPTSSDISKFIQYVENIAQTSFNFLEAEGFNYKHWINLGKSVLILLLVFNRLRVAETCKMRLKLYHQTEKVRDENRKYMNRLELTLADRFSVMKLVENKVKQFTLLTDRHIKYIDMFLKHRSNAGVLETNVYLFGVPSRIQYINASNAIAKYADRCGAAEPETLRATLFRKQVTILSQMLQLNNSEIGHLANIVGHKVKVYKKYTSPTAVHEVEVLSKYFMSIGKELEKEGTSQDVDEEYLEEQVDVKVSSTRVTEST